MWGIPKPGNNVYDQRRQLSIIISQNIYSLKMKQTTKLQRKQHTHARTRCQNNDLRIPYSIVPSSNPSSISPPRLRTLHNEEQIRINGMTRAQLRLLCILRGQNLTNRVKQLHVTLLRILLHSADESPWHGTRGLSVDRCVRTRVLFFVKRKDPKCEMTVAV